MPKIACSVPSGNGGHRRAEDEVPAGDEDRRVAARERILEEGMAVALRAKSMSGG